MDLRKEFRVRAPRLISVRGVKALGHMMLDRVYPDEEPQMMGVGAAAQSETGGPKGTQVKRRSRPQNHHRAGVSAPSVSLPPHAAAGQASDPSSRRV